MRPVLRLRVSSTGGDHERRKNKLQLLHSEKLAKLPWLVHAFSTRQGGVSRVYGGKALNLGFTPHDSRAAVERNRNSSSKSWALRADAELAAHLFAPDSFRFDPSR